jgi:hypothetical protein
MGAAGYPPILTCHPDLAFRDHDADLPGTGCPAAWQSALGVTQTLSDVNIC